MKVSVLLMVALAVACASAMSLEGLKEHDKALPRCNRQNVGNKYPFRNNPRKYWLCTYRGLLLQKCQKGTWFNNDEQACITDEESCEPEGPEVPEEPESEESVEEPEPVESEEEEEETEPPVESEESVEEPSEEEQTDPPAESEESVEEPSEEEQTDPPAESEESIEEPISEETEGPPEESEESEESEEPISEETELPPPEPEESEESVEEPIEESEESEEPVESEETAEPEPTNAPTEAPTEEPTEAPTNAPTPAPTEEPTEAPTSPPEQCEVVCDYIGQYLVNPEDCHSFYQCAYADNAGNLRAVLHQCAMQDAHQRLVFNPNINVCDWSWAYQCTGKPGCSPPEEPEEPGCAAVECQEVGDYHPDPTSCQHFYQCAYADNNGALRAVRHDCPAGLDFNSRLNVCDWPADAQCNVSC